MYSKRRKILLAVLALVAVVLSTIALSACNNEEEGTVPVYKGMTISRLAQLQSASIVDFGNVKFNGDIYGNENETESINENDFLDKINSEFEVIGGTENMFYADANSSAYITVHIENPEDYEIQSFTLNGAKYSSYMFEKGSDMENLILKVDIGNEYGIKSYTIDAIKYIDGTQIRDVKMDGAKTVNVGVYNDSVKPVSEVKEETVGFNDISLNIEVTDTYSLIAPDGTLKAVLYDGSNPLTTKEISLGSNTVKFDNLSPNKTYLYAVVATYDDYAGQGVRAHVIYKKTVLTKYAVLFDGIKIRQNSIDFLLKWNEELSDNLVESKTLWKDGEEIKTLSVDAENIDGLTPDTAYALKVAYKVDGATEEIQLEFKTFPKMSEGLNIADGKVIGIGQCKEETLCIDLPIAPNAFDGVDFIKEVFIGENVTYIGDNAFGTSSNIKYNEDGTAKYLGNESNPYFALIKAEATTAIGEYVINSATRLIACGAFMNCDKLTSVVIPQGVKSIEQYTFQYCLSLESVTIPVSVTYIGESAFFMCVSLKDIYYAGTQDEWEQIIKENFWNVEIGEYIVHYTA